MKDYDEAGGQAGWVTEGLRKKCSEMSKRINDLEDLIENMIVSYENSRATASRPVRESGYYWVKIWCGSGWMIGEYDSVDEKWRLCGTKEIFDENHFTEIGEICLQERK